MGFSVGSAARIVVGLVWAPLVFAADPADVLDVALTFDDLPWVGADPVEGSPADAVARMAAVLNAHDAPATGFVVCDRYAESPEPVEIWNEWGFGIGNHSSSHPDLNSTATTDWVEDVERCHDRLGDFSGYEGFFRFPMLHQGNTPEKRDAVAQALKGGGMRNAHVSIDTSDWILTGYHAEAIRRGDAVLRRVVGEAFIEHVVAATRHADAVARSKLGRSIPLVLLLHANSLVEDFLDELLLTLRSEGVKFVPLARALSDPAYAREDGYFGSKGLSWLYRMQPSSAGDVEWDDAAARRIRGALDAEFSGGGADRSPTSVSALRVGDRDDPRLWSRLEEAGSSERLRSLLISRRGDLVLEAYFNGADEEAPTNLKSVTKSLVALLVGVALDRRWIRGVDDPVLELLGRTSYSDRSVTIASLLTMSSGLKPIPYAQFQARDDWVEAVLSAGVSPVAVGEFLYDTPVVHLLTAAIEAASGRSAREVANRRLLGETSEEIPYWRTGPDGIAFGGNDAYLTPRGMLALGNLVLSSGRANGRRILSEEFVAEATSVQIRPPSRSINHGTLPVRGYGYLWWLTTLGGEPASAALGHGGQMIFVVPSKETVVVVTSRWPMASSTEHYRHVIRVLNEVFLPRAWADGPRRGFGSGPVGELAEGHRGS